MELEILLHSLLLLLDYYRSMRTDFCFPAPVASQRSHPCHPHSQIFQLPDRNSGFPDNTVMSLDRRHTFGSRMGSALQGTRHWYPVWTLPYPSCCTGILPLPYCCCQSAPQHLQDHYTDRNSLSFHLIEAGMACLRHRTQTVP